MTELWVVYERKIYFRIMAKKVVKLTNEEKYEKAIHLEESLSCLKFDSYKATLCDNIVKIYKELGDFKDCKERIDKILKDKEEYIAKSKAFDIKFAEDEKVHTAKIEKERNEKLLKGRVFFFLGMFLFACLMVLAIVFYKSDRYKILKADSYAKTGNYKEAIKIYTKLKGFGPDSDKVLNLKYDSACKKMDDAKKLEKEGKDSMAMYQAAINEFATMENFYECEKKKCECELKIIKNGSPKDSVTFGHYKWRIVEKNKKTGEVLLVKSEPRLYGAYNNEPGDITWEDSSIRKYMNNDFLKEYFSTTEAACIKDTEVEAYERFGAETTPGKNTVDKLFFLNEVQARQYAKYLDTYLTDWWLNCPGDAQDKVSYVSNGEVKYDGYVATEQTINSRPAMWVSYK